MSDLLLGRMRNMARFGLLVGGSALISTASGCEFNVPNGSLSIPPPSPACVAIDPTTSFAVKATEREGIVSVLVEVRDSNADSTFRVLQPLRAEGGTLTPDTTASGTGPDAKVFVSIQPDAAATEVTFDVAVYCPPLFTPLSDGTSGLQITVSLDDPSDGGPLPDAGMTDQERPLRLEVETVPGKRAVTSHE